MASQSYPPASSPTTAPAQHATGSTSLLNNPSAAAHTAGEALTHPRGNDGLPGPGVRASPLPVKKSWSAWAYSRLAGIVMSTWIRKAAAFVTATAALFLPAACSALLDTADKKLSDKHMVVSIIRLVQSYALMGGTALCVAINLFYVLDFKTPRPWAWFPRMLVLSLLACTGNTSPALTYYGRSLEPTEPTALQDIVAQLGQAADNQRLADAERHRQWEERHAALQSAMATLTENLTANLQDTAQKFETMTQDFKAVTQKLEDAEISRRETTAVLEALLRNAQVVAKDVKETTTTNTAQISPGLDSATEIVDKSVGTGDGNESATAAK